MLSWSGASGHEDSDFMYPFLRTIGNLWRPATLLCGLLAVVAVEGSAQIAPMLNNHAFRFGGGGHNTTSLTVTASVAENGMLRQPFYLNSRTRRWMRLSESPEGLSITMSSGSGSSHWTGSHFPVGGDFDSGRRGLVTLPELRVTHADWSVQENGWAGDPGISVGFGTLEVLGTLELNGQRLEIHHRYSLGAEGALLRVATRVTNLSEAVIANLHLWIGDPDDWIGNSDTPRKERGNLTEGEFVRIASGNVPASTLLLSTPADLVILHSSHAGANVIHDRCCSFSNVYNVRPTNSFPEGTGDGSYVLHLPLGDVAPGRSAEAVWLYAAGPQGPLSVLSAAVASQEDAGATGPR